MGTYSVNQKVFIPAHGMGYITEFQTLTLAGQTVRMVAIRIIASGLIIRMPEGKMDNQIQAPPTMEEALEIVRILKAKPAAEERAKEKWHHRLRKYTATLEGGDLVALAHVLKILDQERTQKSLSFSEKSFLERARRVLAAQVEHSLGADAVRRDPEVSQVLAAA